MEDMLMTDSRAGTTLDEPQVGSGHVCDDEEADV